MVAAPGLAAYSAPHAACDGPAKHTQSPAGDASSRKGWRQMG